MTAQQGKRLFDIVGAAGGIVLAAPVIALAAALVRVTLGRPPFFRQVRAGQGGKPYELLKLRTMRDEFDSAGLQIPDSRRLTALGRFLRRTSIDELPQLWNVLRGEMSLVGPRPLYVEYLPCYTARERRRHDTKPGMTGLAQISGRNTLSWDDRLELDVQYVENWSLRLDGRILLKTVALVLRRKDVIDVPGTLQGPLTEYRQAR